MIPIPRKLRRMINGSGLLNIERIMLAVDRGERERRFCLVICFRSGTILRTSDKRGVPALSWNGCLFDSASDAIVTGNLDKFKRSEGES
jgi:hypothetical protein